MRFFIFIFGFVCRVQTKESKYDDSDRYVIIVMSLVKLKFKLLLQYDSVL